MQDRVSLIDISHGMDIARTDVTHLERCDRNDRERCCVGLKRV